MSPTHAQRKILLHLAVGNSLTRDDRKNSWFDSSVHRWFRAEECAVLLAGGYIEPTLTSGQFTDYAITAAGAAEVAHQLPTIERMAG